MTRLLKKISGQIQIALMVFVFNLLFNLFLFILVPYFNQGAQSHKIVWIIFLLSWLFYVLFFLVLRINYSIPLKRLANNLKLIASGQKYNPDPGQIGSEFRTVYLQLAALSRKIQWLLSMNNQLELSYEQAKSEKALVEAYFQKQQDTARILLNIAVLVSRVSDSEQIWDRIIPDLIESLEYDLCLVFRKDEQQLTFFDLGFKGLITTTERLKELMHGYILPRESTEYGLLGKPGVTEIEQSHFNVLLEKMHLKIKFSAFSLEARSLVLAGHIQTDPDNVSDSEAMLGIYADLLQSVFKRSDGSQRNTCDEKVQSHVLYETNRLLTRFINKEKEFNKWIGHDLLAPIRNVEGLISSVYRKYSQKLNDDVLNRLQRIESNVSKERELLETLRLPESATPKENLNFSEILQEIREQLPYDCFRFKMDQPISQFKGGKTSVHAALLLLFYNLGTKYLENETVDVNIHAMEDGNQIEIHCSLKINSKPVPESHLGETLNMDICKNLIYNAGGSLNLQVNTMGAIEILLNFKLEEK